MDHGRKETLSTEVTRLRSCYEDRVYVFVSNEQSIIFKSAMIKKEQEGEEEGDNGAEDRGCKKKGKKGGRTLENQRFGHWSPDEKIKYVAFLEFHKNKFELKQQRRTEKIFKFMSNIIQTRTPDQCRSHHQKMEKHYQDVDSIINHHKTSIRPDLLEMEYQKYVKNEYAKDPASNEASEEIQETKPVIIIPRRSVLPEHPQRGFRSFSPQAAEYDFQLSFLSSINQVLRQCLHSSVSEEKHTQ